MFFPIKLIFETEHQKNMSSFTNDNYATRTIPPHTGWDSDQVGNGPAYIGVPDIPEMPDFDEEQNGPNWNNTCKLFSNRFVS